jgi:hypothetical protein
VKACGSLGENPSHPLYPPNTPGIVVRCMPVAGGAVGSRANSRRRGRIATKVRMPKPAAWSRHQARSIVTQVYHGPCRHPKHAANIISILRDSHLLVFPLGIRTATYYFSLDRTAVAADYSHAQSSPHRGPRPAASHHPAGTTAIDINYKLVRIRDSHLLFFL